MYTQMCVPLHECIHLCLNVCRMAKSLCSIKGMGVIAELLSEATNHDVLSLHIFMYVYMYICFTQPKTP